LIDNHRVRACMRVRTIQFSEADLLSPKSIQPDKRVTTMGAWSESFSDGRVKFRIAVCVEVAGEFVIALILPLLNRRCLTAR